jgi:quercetin dioxygenase-like cupin family protein
MKIIRMREVEGKINQRGVLARELLDHPHARVMGLELKPGDSIPQHSVGVDVFLFVVEGRGTVTGEGRKALVGTGDMVVFPPYTPMSVHADQGEPLVLLNVKTPRP